MPIKLLKEARLKKQILEIIFKYIPQGRTNYFPPKAERLKYTRGAKCQGIFFGIDPSGF